MNGWIALGLFALALVSDVVWAKWASAVQDKKALWGSLMAMLIVVFSSLSIFAYIDSRWYVIPVIVGSGLGTYVAIWHSKRKESHK